MKQGPPYPRPPYSVWLFKYLEGHPSASVDAALESYIKEHSLVVRASLDEPPQITNVRTRLAILEEGDLLNPSNCRSTDLLRYANSLRSSLEMYSHMPPDARAMLAKRAYRSWLTWEKLAYVAGAALCSAFFICLGVSFNVWLVLGIVCGVAAFKFSRHNGGFTSGMSMSLGLMVCIAGFFVGDFWYWHWSPLVPAKQKCEELRRLWTEGRQSDAINVLKDLAANQQPWEQSGDDYY